MDWGIRKHAVIKGFAWFENDFPTNGIGLPGENVETCLVDQYSDMIKIGYYLDVEKKLDRLVHDVQLLHLYADLDYLGLKRSEFNL